MCRREGIYTLTREGWSFTIQSINYISSSNYSIPYPPCTRSGEDTVSSHSHALLSLLLPI